MNLAPMQALAMRRQLVLFGGFASPCRQVALALFPRSLLGALFPDAPLLVVALGIACSPLPIHLPLQATYGSRIRSQFRAEHLQAGFSFLGNERQSGGTQISTNDS